MTNLPILHQELPPVLWHAWPSGREIITRGGAYRFDNHHRLPGDLVFLQYNLRGRSWFIQGKRQYQIDPGQAFLCAYNEDSSYGCFDHDPDPCECCWINMRGAGLKEHWQHARTHFGSILSLKSASSPVLKTMRQLSELADPSKTYDPLEMASLTHRFVMQVVAHLQQRWAKTESPVSQAIDLILREPTQAWSLKSLASEFGCSREHLTRQFTDRVGVSPARYLNEQKIHRAIALLRETQLPLREIARQCGFGTVHTFIRQIQKNQGQSPTQLREQLRHTQSTN